MFNPDPKLRPLEDNRHLRAILDAMPMPVGLFDGAHRCRYSNRRYFTLMEKSAEKVLGRRMTDIVGADMWALLAPHAGRAAEGHESQFEGWEVRGDGSRRYLHRSYVPLASIDRGGDGYYVVIRDLTDLKSREEELERRRAELREVEAVNAAVVASALDCVVVIDEEARVVSFNPVAERTFGRRQNEVVGCPIGDLIVPPHLRARHTAGFERYLKTGERHVIGKRVEVEAMRADGSVFPVELAITEVNLPGRRLFTAYLRDLTPAREAAAEIERQRETLYQNEKLAALGSLLAGVAHELNNPLSIVIGQALMLREDTAAAASTDATGFSQRAQQIQVAAERCAKIVRSFLAIARQRKAERRKVAVKDLVTAAVDLLGYTLKTSSVRVEQEIDPDLPALMGDADQLHQVVVNLILNAQQALDAGAADKHVWVRATYAAARNAIVLRVADNGPGVPDAIRSRIFDPFFTTKPVGIGTGIGLAVSRGMIEAHGGSLALLPNAPGTIGATFEIVLPVEAGDVPLAAPQAAASIAAITAVRAPFALIVDDEPEIGAMLAEILKHDGIDSELAASGKAARLLLEARPAADFDVILCDLRTPDEDGMTFYRWLEANRPGLARRVILVTGDTLGPASSRFLADIDRPVVEKPFTPNDIRQHVATILDMPSS